MEEYTQEFSSKSGCGRLQPTSQTPPEHLPISIRLQFLRKNLLSSYLGRTNQTFSSINQGTSKVRVLRKSNCPVCYSFYDSLQPSISTCKSSLWLISFTPDPYLYKFLRVESCKICITSKLCGQNSLKVHSVLLINDKYC